MHEHRGARPSQSFGAIDNHDPRGQADRLSGAGARAYAAQQNAWEAVATFTVVVVIAHLAGADPDTSATASIGFVAARLLHAVFYLTDVHVMRSLSFMAGLGCAIWLVVLAAGA